MESEPKPWRGTPLTYGPDEKGNMLAMGDCRVCGEQLVGKYAGAGKSREDARKAAVVELEKVFEQHLCKPW